MKDFNTFLKLNLYPFVCNSNNFMYICMKLYQHCGKINAFAYNFLNINYITETEYL